MNEPKRIIFEAWNTDNRAGSDRGLTPLDNSQTTFQKTTSNDVSSTVNKPVNSNNGRKLTTKETRARVYKLRRVMKSYLYSLGMNMRGTDMDLDTDIYKVPRPVKCGSPLGNNVGIVETKHGDMVYSGVETCSSVWVCPSCSRRIRAHRAWEVQQIVKYHQQTGGQIIFFTATLPHDLRTSLAESLGHLTAAWSSMLARSQWRTFKKIGLEHFIKAVEVTVNPRRHGWHPHLHTLLFIDVPLDDDELSRFKADLFSLWISTVEKKTGKIVNYRALDFQVVDDKGAVLAQYISKIQETARGWGVGAELTRIDAKRGRGGSFTPFDLLDDECPLSDSQRRKLFQEYYEATKGKRALTFSNGLKQLTAIEIKEDEDILEDEQQGAVLVWRTTAAAYRKLEKSNPELLAVCLDYAAGGNWYALQSLLPDDGYQAERKARAA